MNKYEKLIELVNEGEVAKAEELFHELVVETSHDIYESIMNDEDEMGGDEADNFIHGVSADEEGMHEDEEEGEMDDMGMDDMGMGGEEEIDDVEDELSAHEADDADLEDRVVDLEDQLDELMAEFEAIMGHEEEEGEEGFGDEGGEFGGEEGGEEGFGDEEEMEEGFGLDESISLQKVTKGIANSTEESSVNKKSTVAANSGGKGMQGKPVKTDGSDEKGRKADSPKDMGYSNQGSGDKAFKSQAPKAKTKGEDSGVNKKSIMGD